MSDAIDHGFFSFQERVTRILSEDPSLFLANQPLLFLFAERHNYAKMFNEPESDKRTIKTCIEICDCRIKLYLNLI